MPVDSGWRRARAAACLISAAPVVFPSSALRASVNPATQNARSPDRAMAVPLSRSAPDSVPTLDIQRAAIVQSHRTVHNIPIAPALGAMKRPLQLDAHGQAVPNNAVNSYLLSCARWRCASPCGPCRDVQRHSRFPSSHTTRLESRRRQFLSHAANLIMARERAALFREVSVKRSTPRLPAELSVLLHEAA